MTGVEFFGANGAEQNVFGGILGVNQLQSGSLIAVCFQQLEAGLNDIARKAREIYETTNDNDIRALAGDILRQTGELKEKE